MPRYEASSHFLIGNAESYAIDQVFSGALDEAAIAIRNVRNFLEAADASLIALAVSLK